MPVSSSIGESQIAAPRNVQYELVTIGAEIFARVNWDAGNSDSESSTRFRLVWGPAAHDPRISTQQESKSDWGPDWNRAPRPDPEFALASAFFLLQHAASARSLTSDQQRPAQSPQNLPDTPEQSSPNSEQSPQSPSAPRGERSAWSGVVTLDQLQTLPIELDRSFVAVVDVSARSYFVGPLEPRRLYVVQVDALSSSRSRGPSGSSSGSGSSRAAMGNSNSQDWRSRGGEEEVLLQSRSMQLLVYSGDALRIRSVDLPPPASPPSPKSIAASDGAGTHRLNARLPHRSRRPGHPSARPARVTVSPAGALKSGVGSRSASGAVPCAHFAHWLLSVTVIMCSLVLLAFRA